MIGWHCSHAPEHLGKTLAIFTQLMCCHATAVGASRLINEILGYNGFKSSEVIKQKNLPGFNHTRFHVRLDLHADAFPQQAERAHTPLIERFVDCELVFRCHYFYLPPSTAWRTAPKLPCQSNTIARMLRLCCQIKTPLGEGP